ncbi:hypothetical protein [Paraliobacillus sp. JSM ZJ581]|uniref:hypothetical protein n=1 Tax=Paraliobacillus sp. JSM ZJ581 TaxID=3342118 RepID=UPI0035A83203
MIGCLMIYVNERNIEIVIDKVMRMINPNYMCKREEWIVTYIYDQDNKLNIWQAALELELEGEKVGYGFGTTMEEAKEDVAQILMKRDGLDRLSYLSLLS